MRTQPTVPLVFLVGVLGFLFAVDAQTPVGTAIHYQGQLNDASGLANGQFDFRYLVYDAEFGGAQVGSTIEMLNEPVTDGQISVDLDFGGAIFAGDARWMEIHVRVAGVGAYFVLSPRFRFAPTPYAVHALNAASGSPGTDGVNCWDLNENGIGDILSEDINGDGFVDVLDCSGPVGPEGPPGPQGVPGDQGE